LAQTPNTKLTLNGAKSSAVDAAILAYVWTITPYYTDTGSSSSGGGGYVLLSAVGPSAVLPAPVAGDYNVTLEVWDANGGYSAASTGLSVDASNVLDWWSTTPGFAAPPAVAAPRPAAALALNGSRADSLVAKARTDGTAVVQLDASGSSDGRGSQLAFFWSVSQTEPAARPVELLNSYAQPARIVHR
jgi:hypothetical protein